MIPHPLRIALDGHTIGTRAGGNESYVLGLLQGLQDCGFTGEVVLYVSPGERSPVSSGGRSPVIGGLEVRDRRLRSRRSLWRLMVELPAALRRDRPSLAHFQYIGPPRSPCPWTVAIHDTSFLHAPELLPRATATRLRLTTGWSVRRAAAVLVPSNWTAESLCARYPEASAKTHVVPLAAAPALSSRSDAPDDAMEGDAPAASLPERFCLYAGRRQRRKNLPFLLSAYAAACKLERQLPPLLLIGPPAREDAGLRRLIGTLGISDRVMLRGYASPATLEAAYRRAEFFCYPCRYEGFGLPLVEAMASGCAALAAAEGGLPETLGDAGRLLPPESVEAWADAMAELTRDAAVRRELARRGLERAQRFDWTHTAQTLLDAARLAGIEGI